MCLLLGMIVRWGHTRQIGVNKGLSEWLALIICQAFGHWYSALTKRIRDKARQKVWFVIVLMAIRYSCFEEMAKAGLVWRVWIWQKRWRVTNGTGHKALMIWWQSHTTQPRFKSWRLIMELSKISCAVWLTLWCQVMPATSTAAEVLAHPRWCIFIKWSRRSCSNSWLCRLRDCP